MLYEVITLVEQYSIDELFGDVTGWVAEREMPEFIRYLQEKVTRELLLPVSIGACNAKWIAKLATSTVKPYGLRVITSYSIHYTKLYDVRHWKVSTGHTCST